MQTLKGKKCLITGANSGLGLATTKIFVKSGAEVIMLCRNEAKAKSAIEEIMEVYPDAKIKLEICDLASIKSLNNFIRQFKEKNSEIDILFNNAAVMKPKYSETEDGFESMFHTNYIAPFLLTNSLSDMLKKSKNSKVINIALPPEKLRLDFNDLQSQHNFSSMETFYKTKLAFLLYSVELSEKLSASSVSVIIAVPGTGPFDSNIGREMPIPIRIIKKIFSKKAGKAAEDILYYATMENTKNDIIFEGRKRQKITPYWNDKEIREKLWQITEELIAKIV